jgi:hypothetical protein
VFEAFNFFRFRRYVRLGVKVTPLGAHFSIGKIFLFFLGTSEVFFGLFKIKKKKSLNF